MERGEVRWALFAPPDEERPVVVLTRTSAIRYLNAVTVAPVTSSIRGVPSEVMLTTEDGIPVESAANLHNIQTIPKKNIGRYITTLSRERMRDIESAIHFSLGIGTQS